MKLMYNFKYYRTYIIADYVLLIERIDNMSDFTRRLPVYLLLDTSGSMSGDPIEDTCLACELKVIT